MQFLPLIMLLCFIIGLFKVYQLGREDFIFLRKNITLEQLFNYFILSVFAGLVGARLLTIISLHNGNLLVSFFSPYVSGFSLTGGLLGGVLFLVLFSRRRRLPLGKLLDVFSVAVVTFLPVGYLWAAILFRNALLSHAMLFILSLIFSLFFTLFLYPRSLRGELREGSMASLFFLAFSCMSGLGVLLTRPKGLLSLVTVDNTITVVILVASIVFFFLNERKALSGRRR